MWTAPDREAPPRIRVLFLAVAQCFIVLLCVLLTTAVAASAHERSIRVATVERVLDVAHSIAELDQVRRAVQQEQATAATELQPLADLLQRAAGVDYVVITDAGGIRLTHPSPEERGSQVSTDPSEVLAGAEFVGTETGTLGSTLRAKVPVYDGDRVVGTASVGILETEIARDYDRAIAGMLPWVLGAIVVGCLVSAGVNGVIGRRVRRLERHARQLETQRQIASALRDQTHEFRTRLHVIRGLVAEGEGPAALDYIASIAPVTTTTARHAGIADPRLRAVLDDIGTGLHDCGGRFEIDPLSTVPVAVLDDADLIVIANLVRNAAEAAAGRVRVLVTADEEHLHLAVDDDGPGIPPAQIDRIFDRGVSGKGPERGVGLDLVRREISRRGGTVTVGRSEWGGARFTVDAPAAARTAAP